MSSAKCINAYDLIAKIEERKIEWDYTGQSGAELIDFIKEMIDDIPYFFSDEDLFLSMCMVNK